MNGSGSCRMVVAWAKPCCWNCCSMAWRSGALSASANVTTSMSFEMRASDAGTRVSRSLWPSLDTSYGRPNTLYCSWRERIRSIDSERRRQSYRATCSTSRRMVSVSWAATAAAAAAQSHRARTHGRSIRWIRMVSLIPPDGIPLNLQKTALLFPKLPN